MFCTRVFKMATLLVGASMLLTLTASANAQKTSHAYSDPDAYAVYSAVLPQLWPVAKLDAHHLVIRVETKSRMVCVLPAGAGSGAGMSVAGTRNVADDGPSSTSGVDQAGINAAIAQYNQVNSTSWMLERKFQTPLSYSLIRAGELEGISHHVIGAWDLFFQYHADSGGWIQFSAVGFSPDKKTAAVYAEYACGQHCGGGMLYVLQKKGSQWLMATPPANSCSEKLGTHQMTGF